MLLCNTVQGECFFTIFICKDSMNNSFKLCSRLEKKLHPKVNTALIFFFFFFTYLGAKTPKNVVILMS